MASPQPSISYEFSSFKGGNYLNCKSSLSKQLESQRWLSIASSPADHMFTVLWDKGQIKGQTNNKETAGSFAKAEPPCCNSKSKYCNLIRLTDFVINSWTHNKRLYEENHICKEILSFVRQCWWLFTPRPPFSDVLVNGESGLQKQALFLAVSGYGVDHWTYSSFFIFGLTKQGFFV